jgi:hypothetical protein
MSFPAFTAHASLYRTGATYHSSRATPAAPSPALSVTPAYRPGPETQAACNQCMENGVQNFAWCLAIGATGCGLGSIACGPFYPACFAVCMGGVLGGCDLHLLREEAICALDDCCPKVCGPINPLDPGSGCCDRGENCVSRNDPNARQGCCPVDQAVCAGKCCPRGYTCCGETCCPPNYFCRDGFCSDVPGSLWPDDWVPPKPEKPPLSICLLGHTPCGGKCCPPGLECCSVPGGVACMTSCLH